MGKDLLIQRKAEEFAVLKVVNGPFKNKQFRLLASKIIIGRHNSCDIVLDSQSCSRKHAAISYNEVTGKYTIESLSLNNPVIVNSKTISKQQLQEKDRITLGNTELVFSSKTKLPSLQSAEHKQFQQQQKQLKSGNSSNYITRVGLLAMIVLVGGFLLLDNETKKEQTKTKDRTQAEMEEEIKVLQKLNKETAKKLSLSSFQKEARIAFIRGFRDYRKGYFLNSLKTFEHCTTLYKNHDLCISYAKKARAQLEKLIKKQVILGKTYKNNNQFNACESTFKKILIMVRDTSRPVYREALENRRYCRAKLKHKI